MKEKLLFELYKDTSKLSDVKFREKLRKKVKGVNISDLHAKIIKYQNEKYGGTLDNSVEILYHEDKLQLYERSIKRKYSRKKRKPNK